MAELTDRVTAVIVPVTSSDDVFGNMEAGVMPVGM